MNKIVKLSIAWNVKSKNAKSEAAAAIRVKYHNANEKYFDIKPSKDYKAHKRFKREHFDEILVAKQGQRAMTRNRWEASLLHAENIVEKLGNGFTYDKFEVLFYNTGDHWNFDVNAAAEDLIEFIALRDQVNESIKKIESQIDVFRRIRKRTEERHNQFAK